METLPSQPPEHPEPSEAQEKPKARRMKAIGFEVEEMMKLFLVIIIGLGVVILIIAASGGISSILTEFCLKNPGICGADSGGDSINFAKASTDALSTAIICSGSDSSNCPCKPTCPFNVENYKSENTAKGSLITTSDITGFQSAVKLNSKQIDVTCSTVSIGVKCDCSYTYGSRSGDISTTIIAQTKAEGENECRNWLVGQGRVLNQIMPIVYCADNKVTSCNVNNFQLPQKISKAEDWIDGFGDPLYLLYWQKFPEGEDTSWSKQSTWFSGASKMMFWLMCGTRVATGIVFPSHVYQGIQLKKTQTLVKESSDKINSLMSKLSTKGKFPGNYEIFERYVEGKLVSRSYITASKSELLGDAALKTNVLSSVPTSKIASSFENLKKLYADPKIKTVLQTGEYSAIAAIASSKAVYEDARYGSEMGKFINEPNRIVLQQALMYKSNAPKAIVLDTTKAEKNIANPSKQDILDLGKPIMLNKNNKLFGLTYSKNLQSLYFASPCQADLKVTSGKIACQSYSYDSINGQTKCEEPDTEGWFDNPEMNRCGALITGIEQSTNFLTKEKELINDMRKTQTLVKKSIYGSDGIETIIYDPINSVSIKVSSYKTPPLSTTNPLRKIYFEQITGESGSFDIEPSASSCVKSNAVIGLDLLKNLIGVQDDLTVCTMNDAVYKKFYPSASFNTVVSFIAKENNNIVNEFFAIAIFYSTSSHRTIILLKDNDGDGYLDELNHFFYISGTTPEKYRMFKDTNSDGKVDNIMADKCFVDGIVVSADKSKYKSSDHNFCYTSSSPAITIGTTVAAFAIDSCVKRIPTAYSFIIGAAADCLLAWVDYSGLTQETWPG